MINRAFVRVLMTSAALAAGALLTGCNSDQVALATSAKANQPVPPKLVATIAEKDMDTQSPILVRVFKQEAELEAKRKELGVEDAVKTVPGVTSKMLVKFGENDIKTVDDLAGCATDDLVGWTERKDSGEQTKHAGILDGLEVSRDDAEAMVMQARVKAGWISEADIAKPEAEDEDASEGQPA